MCAAHSLNINYKKQNAMKKFQLGLAAALMLTAIACTSEEPQAEKPTGIEAKTITFTFGDTFQQRAMTRAAITSLSLTDLWMFDYVGDELQQTIHQSSTDEGFGAISASMGYGAHTLYFVASRGTTPTTDTDVKSITWAKPSDTYWATASITVAPSSAASQSVTLGRVATRLRITVTDEIPANAATFNVTPSQWYYGINYTTGAGVGLQANYPRPVTIPANYIGTSGELMISIFGFVPSSDWQTDVTATLTASDESVLGQVTLEDVTLNKNITTSYSGGILGTTKAFTLTADDAWGEDDVHVW
jgi:hypothetical protein